MRIDTIFRAHGRVQRRWNDAYKLRNALEGVYTGERLTAEDEQHRKALLAAVELKCEKLQRQANKFNSWFMRKGYSATLNLSNAHQQVLMDKVKRLEAQQEGAQEFVRVLLFWHDLYKDGQTPYMTYESAEQHLLGACARYAEAIRKAMQSGQD